MSVYLSVHICMHVTYTNGSGWNMYMSVQKDILLRTNTRNTTKSPDRVLVVGVDTRPAGLKLWPHRKTWRTWVCMKLQCLWVRFRLDDVSTHSGVNSWPSHYRPCEQSSFVGCLRSHLVMVWMIGNKKQSDNRNSVNRPRHQFLLLKGCEMQ